MFSNLVISRNIQHSCKLLIVGGGSGGCTMAAKLSKYERDIIILEPNETHYYQPLFTLVGGGMKTLSQARRSTRSVLPKNLNWIQDKVHSFNPQNNSISISNGDIINYEYMVVSVGLQLNYDQIIGLRESLDTKDSGVCTNYSSQYVENTYQVLKKFKEGNAIFTFPNTPIKCAGAPQKIMYITDDYLRKNDKRNKANIIYKTSLPVIFGVKKYAQKLQEICDERNILVDTRQNLIQIDPIHKRATFELLDESNKTVSVEYSMLHVTPPMSPPDVLIKSNLSNNAGYLDVNPYTLRHNVYDNVFGIGDCTSCPTSKTAAAVAAQSNVVLKNIINVINGKSIEEKYDGYTSCPLVTGYSKCILAEFDYDPKPLETFPFNQGNELRSMFLLKNHALPFIYWNLMLKGYWSGPKIIRKILHLGLD